VLDTEALEHVQQSKFPEAKGEMIQHKCVTFIRKEIKKERKKGRIAWKQ
jgi:hypothetical protein